MTLDAAQLAADGFECWPAPAKLNLMLRVTGRRADGRHDLQTVFRLLDFGDDIWLAPNSIGAVRRIHGLPGLPPTDDLAVRAAELFQGQSGISQGIDIAIDKRVPAGGGMGGGSSDAATVLVAMNAMAGWPLRTGKLEQLGAMLGADVPVFVRGRNAFALGTGEQLTAMVLPAASYLLVDPGVGMPTGEAFAAPELTRDQPVVTMMGFAQGDFFDNAFMPVIRRRLPVVDRVLRALERYGRARMTGSGTVCFVEFGSADAAFDALADWLGRQLEGKGWVATGIERSPLRAKAARTLRRAKLRAARL